MRRPSLTATRWTRPGFGAPSWKGSNNSSSSSSADRPFHAAAPSRLTFRVRPTRPFRPIALLRWQTSNSKAAGKVLQERSLAVSSVPTEDDRRNSPFADGVRQHPIQSRFDVGVVSEVGVEPPCLCIAEARAGIGAQYLPLHVRLRWAEAVRAEDLFGCASQSLSSCRAAQRA